MPNHNTVFFFFELKNVVSNRCLGVKLQHNFKWDIHVNCIDLKTHWLFGMLL